MLDRQLRGGFKNSLDFDSSSFNGIIVNPSSTSQKPETPAEKKRREMLDQMKYMIFIGNDPSKQSELDEMMKMQENDPNSQMGSSPLEQFYRSQLQEQRTSATNRAKAEFDYRNDNGHLVAPASTARPGTMSASPLGKSSFDASRAPSTSTSLFPDLFNQSSASPRQTTAQQTHMNNFRQMLNASPAPGSPSFRSAGPDSIASSYGNTADRFSSPAANPAFQQRAALSPAVSPSVPVSQTYEPAPQQNKPQPPPVFSPPKRRF